MEVDDRDVIHHFIEALHSIELWRKMFESNPKTITDMMAVVNKHADLEDPERAHCQHKTKNDSSERPPQWDNCPECQREDRPPHHDKTTPSHPRAGSASVAPTTPLLSPRGLSSVLPSTRRTWTGSWMASVHGIRMRTTLPGSAARSPTVWPRTKIPSDPAEPQQDEWFQNHLAAPTEVQLA